MFGDFLYYSRINIAHSGIHKSPRFQQKVALRSRGVRVYSTRTRITNFLCHEPVAQFQSQLMERGAAPALVCPAGNMPHTGQFMVSPEAENEPIREWKELER